MTLVYLAVQVRQNSRQLRENASATRAATYQAALDLVANINLEVAKHEHLAGFIALTPEERDRLSSPQRVQWQATVYVSILVMQHLYLQHLAGLIDEPSWRTHAGQLRRLMRTPVTQELWRRRRDEFDPVFAQQLDDLIASASRREPAA